MLRQSRNQNSASQWEFFLLHETFFRFCFALFRCKNRKIDRRFSLSDSEIIIRAIRWTNVTDDNKRDVVCTVLSRVIGRQLLETFCCRGERICSVADLEFIEARTVLCAIFADFENIHTHTHTCAHACISRKEISLCFSRCTPASHWETNRTVFTCFVTK